jgi:lysophospholipase L1-like esterase
MAFRKTLPSPTSLKRTLSTLQTLPPTRQDIRLCFIGDSFTLGAGDDTILGFPGRLTSQLRTTHKINATSYNLGVRRDTSLDIAKRWESEVQTRLKHDQHEYAGRLVFSFGTNDSVFENGHRRVSTVSSLTNAKDILVRAKKQWPTAMLGPPWTSVRDVDEGNRLLSREFGGLCEEIGVPFLALYDLLEGNEVWAREAEAGDGIHPNAGGYELIARAVGEWEGWEEFVRGAL